MPCIHTGCDVFFDEYETWAHGDLHKVAGAYIFIGHEPTRKALQSDWCLMIGEGFSRTYGDTYIAVCTNAIPLSIAAGERHVSRYHR